MAVPVVTSVQAQHLSLGDCFTYAGGTVTVTSAPKPLGDRWVEVEGTDEHDATRWIDYGRYEMVEVVSGPSTQVKAAPVAAPVKSATQRAREAVRLGKVRSLPASAALVLYAAAAAQDEVVNDDVWAPTLASIATGAGLAQSTTRGHLVALRAKGLVRETGLGWLVVA